MRPLHIVGIGGTTRAGSSTEKALRWVLRDVERRGATTTLLCGGEIDLPAYAPGPAPIPARASRIVDEVRRADALVLASPGYHGGISGLLKNAIDYLEELKDDERCYLSGMPVGCLVTANGHQAAVTTMTALRFVVHALRGWPTPLGVTIVSATPVFDGVGSCVKPEFAERMGMMADEILEFCETRRRTEARRPQFAPKCA